MQLRHAVLLLMIGIAGSLSAVGLFGCASQKHEKPALPATPGIPTHPGFRPGTEILFDDAFPPAILTDADSPQILSWTTAHIAWRLILRPEASQLVGRGKDERITILRDTLVDLSRRGERAWRDISAWLTAARHPLASTEPFTFIVHEADVRGYVYSDAAHLSLHGISRGDIEHELWHALAGRSRTFMMEGLATLRPHSLDDTEARPYAAWTAYALETETEDLRREVCSNGFSASIVRSKLWYGLTADLTAWGLATLGPVRWMELYRRLADGPYPPREDEDPAVLSLLNDWLATPIIAPTTLLEDLRSLFHAEATEYDLAMEIPARWLSAPTSVADARFREMYAGEIAAIRSMNATPEQCQAFTAYLAQVWDASPTGRSLIPPWPIQFSDMDTKHTDAVLRLPVDSARLQDHLTHGIWALSADDAQWLWTNDLSRRFKAEMLHEPPAEE